MVCDQRGATALMFGLTALVILGFAGLGTEVGVWYLVRREAQGAADAAAIAGALAANAEKAVTGATSGAVQLAATNSAESLAATNGLGDGTTNSLSFAPVSVTPTYLPSSYTFVSGFSSNAGTTFSLDEVEVTILDPVIPLISSLFGGKGVTVGASSTAVVEPLAQVCALSLGNINSGNGDLTVQSGTIDAGNCALASNAADGNAINVLSGAALNAQAVATVGGCCGAGTTTIGSAVAGFGLGAPAAYHPPTPDPYGGSDPNGSPDAINFGTFAGGSCVTAPAAVSGLIQLTSQAPAQAYCSDVDVVAGQTLQFTAPGIYIFYNASLNVTGGSIQCQFCTSGNGATGISVVFLGTGTLNLANASVSGNMTAASSVPAPYAALSGILFYGSGSAPVTMQIASSVASLNGAIYFPNAALTFTNMNTSNCLSLVAGTLVLYGIVKLSVDGCSQFNTLVADTQGARIVQ